MYTLTAYGIGNGKPVTHTGETFVSLITKGLELLATGVYIEITGTDTVMVAGEGEQQVAPVVMEWEADGDYPLLRLDFVYRGHAAITYAVNRLQARAVTQVA